MHPVFSCGTSCHAHWICTGIETGRVPAPRIVSATLALDFDDLRPRLTRQDYSVKELSDQFQSKPAEIKRFLSSQLEAAQTRELTERMRMAGLSLRGHGHVLTLVISVSINVSSSQIILSNNVSQKHR